ncbi:ABC transporter substrate-binding protein [Marispirochaeta aestuarii]|uniref:ABC transporter substrate-binding protein n=1 Tax=Marispirochaeta aestuarii TaxID=1963862 RepID=UPI0029C7C505|nr:ABC transporter substrate-binding protein [Marispirochaeta aestuarii]
MSRYGRYLIILLIFSALAGCSRDRTGSETPLQIYSRLWTPLREQTFIREELKRFYSETGIETELLLYTDTDMDRMAASGELSEADLIIFYGNRLASLADAIDFVDLREQSKLFEDRTFLFKHLGTEKKDTWEYFLPLGADVYLLIASREAASARPVGADGENITWPQVAEWIQRASRQQGRGLLAVTGVPNKSLVYFMAGPILSYGGGFPDLTSEAALEALRLLQGMRWVFHPLIENFDTVIDPLVDGSAWFAFAHCAHAGSILQESPGNFDVYPAPSGPAGMGSVSGFSAVGIPGGTKNAKAALALVEYLTRPEVQARISKGVGGFIPTVLEASDYLGEEPLARVIRYGLHVLDSGRTREIPLEYGEWGNVKHVYESVFFSMVLSGRNISADSLKWAQTELDKLKTSQ